METKKRYRCKGCGGVTRFTVTVDQTVQYYHHQKLNGSANHEEVEILSTRVKEVVCRYCGNGNHVIEEEVMGGPDTG